MNNTLDCPHVNYCTPTAICVTMNTPGTVECIAEQGYPFSTRSVQTYSKYYHIKVPCVLTKRITMFIHIIH